MNSKIPIIFCIDLEPDATITDPKNPLPWTGCERAFDWLRDFRRRAEKATGSPARLNWFLRMDPQIKKTYGSIDWGAKRFESEFKEGLKYGDTIGLHPHAYHWDDHKSQWFVDHGSWEWVRHCTRVSFDAYRNFFGRTCEIFRHGDRWFDSKMVPELESLGCKYDMTVEPGHATQDTYHPEVPHTGELPDMTQAPREPYRPSHQNYLVPDPSRKNGLWEIPMSTGFYRPKYRKLDTLRYWLTDREKLKIRNETLNVYREPELIRAVTEPYLRRTVRPYLAPVMRPDLFLKSYFVKRLDLHGEYFLTHPEVRRFVFTTPEEGLKLMGLTE